jgi:hypothetical protein
MQIMLNALSMWCIIAGIVSKLFSSVNCFAVNH